MHLTTGHNYIGHNWDGAAYLCTLLHTVTLFENRSDTTLLYTVTVGFGRVLAVCTGYRPSPNLSEPTLVRMLSRAKEVSQLADVAAHIGLMR